MATTGDSTPSYQPVIHHSAKRELQDVPPDTRDGLVSIIKACARKQEPSQHSQATPIHGHPLFRVKCDKYRALCSLQKPELQVLVVAHRERVYDLMGVAEERL